MQNQLNDSVYSIGCVICSLNFTSKADTNVITKCGHLYHKQCLTKWFASSKELNGHNSCPDCRTHLSDESDMKPIFLRFIQDDSIPSANELVHLQSENVKLIHRISEKEDEIRKIGNELKTERSKNTRLENRVEKLLAQLKEHENLEEIPKKAAKTAVKGQVVTKELRNRQCTYRI